MESLGDARCGAAPGNFRDPRTRYSVALQRPPLDEELRFHIQPSVLRRHRERRPIRTEKSSARNLHDRSLAGKIRHSAIDVYDRRERIKTAEFYVPRGKRSRELAEFRPYGT